MTWRARFWRSIDDVGHVLDFICDNPLLLDDALDAAIAHLPHSHFVWHADAITVTPRAEQ